MPFDIKKARESGYSDDEISNYLLLNSPNFDVKGALSSGYSLDEISNELATPTLEKPTVQPKSLLKKTWESLNVPSEMSKKGLNEIASLLPEAGEGVAQTRFPAVNALLGTPRVAVETLADTAPGFISRESIATAGGLSGLKLASPAISAVAKPAGKYIGKGLEELSGLVYKTPGALGKAFKDPTLFFAKGKEAAGAAYNAAKGGEVIREELALPMSKMDFVTKSLDLAKKGELTALEALEARKELSAIRSSMPGEAFRVTRAIFDDIAKTKFSPADVGYSRGVIADELRRTLPINKSGTPSIVKGGVMSIIPKAAAAVLSPAAQAIGATTLGAGTKAVSKLSENPLTSSAVVSLLDRINFDKVKNKYLKESK